MAGRKRYSVLRDPVHGDVHLTHEELALLDTPEMQRLRGIKQLGSADLVYPGARHSRFEHSIGTTHMAQRMIDAVNLAHELDPAGCLPVGEEEARVIRLAALVHDVTHIPFGHNVEDQAGLMQRHDAPERYAAMLGRSTVLGRRLSELGVQRDVLGILTADAPLERERAIPPYWGQIVSDTICSDILDYLARDAYYTGLRIQVDPRLVSYFRVDRRSGKLFIDLAKHELLREDILSEVVRLLEARYYFSERVYYHHAKVAAGALVSRAVELVLLAGTAEESDFHGTTDASLLDLLERAGERAGEPTAARVRELVQSFRERRLPKRACVFPLRENAAVQEELVARYFAPAGHAERARVEGRIADLVRFATGRQVDVLVVCPAARMQLKEAETHVRWPGTDELRPLSAHAARVPRLADLEQSYRNLWKFYVFAASDDPAVLARVAEIAEGEFPGARNVYRPGARQGGAG
jgi:HD superfamily phosphohydrolase